MARSLFLLLLLCAAASAHGGGARSNASPGVGGGVIVPIGGGGGGTHLGPVDGPLSGKDRSKRHTWEIWWTYHREYYLALRTRGKPVSGVRETDDRKQRADLREGRLIDLLLVALDDKDAGVRSAAAVALGKFGPSKGVRGPLERHTHFPPEGWPNVREGALFGTGLFGLAENRRFLDGIARDKDRDAKEQGIVLTGLMMDGTPASADLLASHVRNVESGIRGAPEAPPARAEQEKRRFGVHLLGFVEAPGYDEFLWQVATGGRGWGGGEQSMALTALGRRRARDFKEPVFKLLYARQEDKNVKRAATIALGMMMKPEDAEDLRRLARYIRDSRQDPIAQNFAVMALGQVGGETAVELLRDLLRERVFGDEEDRAFVHLALGLSGMRSAAAREALLVEYESADTETEQSVLALACGLAKVHEAVPITIRAIENPKRRETPGLGVRGRFGGWAALGLGFHGDARGLDAVRRVLAGNNDPVVREQAAIAVALLLGNGAVAELSPMLREAGTSHTKAAIVTAFGVLPEPSPEAVDALIRVYRDDSMPNPVRAIAVCGLGALADPRPIPVSALLVRNYNYFVRCLALDEIASYL